MNQHHHSYDSTETEQSVHPPGRCQIPTASHSHIILEQFASV